MERQANQKACRGIVAWEQMRLFGHPVGHAGGHPWSHPWGHVEGQKCDFRGQIQTCICFLIRFSANAVIMVEAVTPAYRPH